MDLGWSLRRCRSLGFLTGGVEFDQLGTDVGTVELFRCGFYSSSGDHIGFDFFFELGRSRLIVEWLLTREHPKEVRLRSLLNHLRSDLFVEFFISRWLTVVFLPDV